MAVAFTHVNPLPVSKSTTPRLSVARCCAERPQKEGGGGFGLPIWAVATAMQNFIRPREETAVEVVDTPRKDVWRGPSERLRDMVDEVNGEVGKMRRALQTSASRAETAERAGAAARSALLRARKSRNAEIERAAGALPETTKMVLLNLYATQVRAARAEKEAEEASRKLEEALAEVRRTKDQAAQYIVLAALTSATFFTFATSL